MGQGAADSQGARRVQNYGKKKTKKEQAKNLQEKNISQAGSQRRISLQGQRRISSEPETEKTPQKTVTPCNGHNRPIAIVFGAEMSHRHYWAEIEYQGADVGSSSGALRAAARCTEKLGLIVPIGSRSSILGGPGELNFE